jgi:hypothetical protein
VTLARPVCQGLDRAAGSILELDVVIVHDVHVVGGVLDPRGAEVAVVVRVDEAADARSATVVVDDLLVLGEAVRVDERDGVAADSVRAVEPGVDRPDREVAGADAEAGVAALGVHRGEVTDEGLGVLGHDGHAHGRTDSGAAAAGDVAGDHVELERLVGGDTDVAVGEDARSVERARPVAHEGLRRDVEDRYAGVHGDCGATAEAGAGGDRRDVLARGCIHRGVAGDGDGSVAGDGCLGVLGHDLDVCADAHAGGAADAHGAGKAEDRGGVSRCDGQARTADVGTLVHVGLGGVVHDVHDGRAGDASGAATGAAHRDQQDVLVLGGRDRDTAAAGAGDVRVAADARVDHAVTDQDRRRGTDTCSARPDRDVARRDVQVGGVARLDVHLAGGGHDREAVDVGAGRVGPDLVQEDDEDRPGDGDTGPAPAADGQLEQRLRGRGVEGDRATAAGASGRAG